MSNDFKLQYKNGMIDEYQEPFTTVEIQTKEDYEHFRKALERGNRMQWHSADEPPKVAKDGSSDYILLNISNFSLPLIGIYLKEEDDSGAYYTDYPDGPLCKRGFFVNAWMALPERYEEDEERLPFD